MHKHFEIHVNLTEPLKTQMDSSASETEEDFGGVQTATQGQRLHSTAQKCSTFNTAADVQEDTWLIPHGSSLQSVRGGGGRLRLMLKTSQTPASAIVWGRKVFICDIENDKEQPARGHRGYPAGISQKKK